MTQYDDELSHRTFLRHFFLLLLSVGAFLPSVANACFPKRSDVSLSSRWQHTAPVGNPNTFPWLDTDGAESAFAATRLDWVYTTNATFVARSRIPVQASINSNNPDNFEGPATYTVGRILNLFGEKITAPWMVNFTPTPYYGCINNPLYRQLVMERAMKLLRPVEAGGVGACGLQHDDPWSNYESTTWPRGGCYCSHCIKKFSLFLAQRGIIANATGFNYSAYLIARGGYGKGSAVLRAAFEEFQAGSVQGYLVDLVSELRNASTLLSTTCSCKVAVSGNVPRSINVSQMVRNITEPLEYAVTELDSLDATPDFLFYHLVEQRFGGGLSNGKFQVFTMPKTGVITTAIKVLARKVAGLSVALGSYMVAPWDVYLPGPPPGSPARFYANASDFADLGLFVRNWSSVIENCSELAASWFTSTTVPSSPWTVTVSNSSQVFWTIRRWPGASYVAVHLVDWDWASGSSVQYPIPTNVGHVHSITVVSAAKRMIAGAAWLAPDGASHNLPFVVIGESGLRFNTTNEMLKPWAVVLIRW